MTYLYLAITTDEYELPICVEDTAEELAKKLGVNRNVVHSSISKNRSGKILGRKIIKVKIEE